MDSKEFERQLEQLATLDEPIRRRLYAYVAGRDGDVGRDEAARAMRISRALAAFHLDKLVEANLLQATFRRLSGRTGPGAGRPAKLYRRSSAQLDVSLPRRRYELAAHVLIQALAKGERAATLEALRNAARGEPGRSPGPRAPSRPAASSRVVDPTATSSFGTARSTHSGPTPGSSSAR